MTTLGRLRRAPWLAGAVTLVFTAALVAPLAARFGLRYWPFYAGGAAAILLVAGWIERTWKSRPAFPAPPRSKGRSRFRVVPGGKAARKKGNGKAPSGSDDEGDEPRWLM
jgi:hypothetical protein